MVRVEVRLANRGEWVRVYDSRDSTVFVVNDAPPAIGKEVRIDLYIGSDGPRVILRGAVVARRTRGDNALPRGFSVALGPYEREKVNYLNGFIRGGLLDLRKQRRLPIRLRVEYGDINGPRQSFTRDINEEGIFIITESPLPEESELDLVIHFPGFPSPHAIAGVVSHTVLVEDEDVPGMGIRFRFEPGQQDTFTAVIDNLEKKFVEGELPDDCLL